jgi:hypothetical protein
MVSEDGAMEREKSGGGAMVAVTEEVCESAPEVPVRVRVALLPAVAGVAEMATFCAVPGVKVREDGCAVTPLGRPEMATDTMPVNPLAAVALTLTCCAGAPGTSVRVAGVEEREKSAVGFGEELLQEVSKRQAKKLEKARDNFEEEAMRKTPGAVGNLDLAFRSAVGAGQR